MSRIGTIARRSFLIGSAAILGGVAFGVYEVRKEPANPLLDDLAPGEAALTAWVRIDASGITLIGTHTDLGQGARQMQAALIAEELDLDFGQFAISPGTPGAAYWNTAMGGDQAPFLASDDSTTAAAVRGALGAVVKVMGVQATGGSSSTPDSFDKLRRAGAIARETLKAAASRKTGIAAADLKTARGAVILPDRTQLTYVELAPLAAGLPLVQDVALRDPSQWRLIGKPMQRFDIVAKSTGTLTYGIDLAMEGMLHATVRTNPRQGGAMNSYDASAAEKMRGVLGIVPLKNGVAVLADNTWRAFQAANAITFDWGPAPYPAEMAAHWQAVAASFTPERLDHQWRHDGDVEKALTAGAQTAGAQTAGAQTAGAQTAGAQTAGAQTAGAQTAGAITAEYRAPYVGHQPLEPLSALVKFTPERIDIWASHQLPRFVQQKVAEVTGLNPGQVFLHNQFAGGSFGHRLEFDWILWTAEIARAKPGIPIKMTLQREEDFAHDYPRQIGMGRGRGSVKDGKVDSFDLQIATVSAMASQSSRLGQSLPGPDGQIAAGAWNLPYAVPNFRVRAYKVPELAPVSSWRSVGASTAGFFADCFLDELIHAAGADPMAERLALMTNPVSRKVLEAVAQMSGWGTPLGPNRGRGVAFVESFGTPVAEVVEVTKTDKGIRIDRVFVAADVGRVVDPVNFDNQVKGAVVWGLGHAMNCQITYADGQTEQRNFDAHDGMRLHQCPEITVQGLENGPHVRGVGEPPVPPAAAALANAIFAATGVRLREMPFNKGIDFV